MRFRHTFEEQSGFSARSSALSQRRRRLFSPCHAPTAIAMQFRLTNDRQARSFSASSTLKLPSNEPFRTHLPVKHSEPTVHSFYHKSTSTFSYVVAGSPHDAESGVLDVVIIDSVLDYDAASGSVTTESADGLMSFCAAQNYRVTAVLETHAHADHLSAGFYISRSLHVGHLNFAVNPPLIIGKGIEEVQRRFAPRYGLTQDDLHGSFDLLIDEKMNLRVGNSRINAIHLPGHTSDHMGYKIGENIFTGDVVFLVSSLDV